MTISRRLCRLEHAVVCSFFALTSFLFGQQGIPNRPEVDDYYNGVFPEEPPVIDTDWTTVLAFPNLVFNNPLGLTHIPGTNQLIVWEREGRIWSFENDPDTTTKSLVLDLSENCQGWDDSGLLGVALHPDFQNNRQMWVYYNWRGGIAGASGDLGEVIGDPNTRPPTGTPTRDRLSRFELDSNFQAEQSDEYVVIDQKDNSVWHNGGGMFFHPDNGFLYLTNGDDQNAGLNTQRIDRGLFSCVIRIDVDRRGGAISHPPVLRAAGEVSPDWPRYYVPNDNPFVGQPNVLEEIYAIGLRSPHRMTVDPVTKRIFIGDVGAASREEISVIEPTDPTGLNFQWNRIEGNGGSLTPPYIGTEKRPIIDYGHGEGSGSCVVGGYVYRGTEFPELTGRYIFGDNMSGIVWYLDESVSPSEKVTLAVLPDGPGPNSGNDYRGLSSFGLDADGELYICRMSTEEGRIYKLERGSPPQGAPLPATLSATGLFDDLSDLATNSALIPYDLNEPFWSDNAKKSRFAIVPDAKTVAFAETGDWDFPAGSVLVKHFELPVSDVDPDLTRRLETRVLVKQEGGDVYGATYKWREDQSDADLLESSLTESVAIQTESTGSYTGVDIGNPALSGSTTRDGDLYTIIAGGVDIWGNRDEFHFAHQERSGDFDIAVRIESVVQSDLYTKTGLMVRESLAADARHVMALVFPSNAPRNNNVGGYEFQYRDTTGGNATALYPPAPQPTVAYPNTWLRMQREGDTFIAYSSSDGYTWTEYSRTTLDFPDEIHFGMAVTAHTSSPRTVAKFHLHSRRQPWYFPSRQDCITCHNVQAGGVLGPSTRQFNRDFDYPNGTLQNQIMAWAHAGIFDEEPAEPETLDKLANHADITASLEDRARSYLDANCSYCHLPGGVQALWDARFDTPFSEQGIYYGSVVDSLGNPDARVIVPNSLADSILHHRVSVTGENQMPPLARNTVDEEGVAVLREWILEMEEETVSPPANLVATALSQTAVNLSWSDAADNEQGFSVERSLDGLNFELIGSVPGNATEFTDTNAEPFQTNSYRVSAFGEYVDSEPSNLAEAIPNIGPPAPEIRVLGQGNLISHNDLEPKLSNGTDFGTAETLGATVTRTFTIENLGNDELILSGTPRIRIEGADAGVFLVTSDVTAGVAGPGSTTFQIAFSPDDFGFKVATVVIESNDSSEPLTSFAIAGSVLDEALVAWWKLDEGEGMTIADVTSYENFGFFTEPNPRWQSTGAIDGSLAFTGEFGQSVSVPSSSSLNPETEITIAAWVFAEDWNGNRRILQKGNGDNQYRLLVEENELVWEIDDVGRLEAELPPIGEWFHLAATYNGSRMRVFINGRAIEAIGAFGFIPATNDELFLGTKTADSVAGDHLNGALDDVRIYERSLSAVEIGDLAGITEEASLVGWWPFDETSGTSAGDASSFGQNGVLTAPAATWNSGGRVNGALEFSGDLGQGVSVDSSEPLNPSFAITVSAWVYADNWDGNRRILQKGSNDDQYRLLAEGGNFVWDIAGVGRLETPQFPPVNEWVHIAGTYDGDRMILYYNGEGVASLEASGPILFTDDPLYIGTKSNFSNNPSNYFHGMLDEIRIYNHPLSSEDISQLALEGNQLAITATDGFARKGTGDFGMLTVTRTGATELALPISLALVGDESNATPGIDFSTSPALNNFVIPSGASEASLSIQPLENSEVTGPLNATVKITPPTSYHADPDSATVTIDDSPYHNWKIASFGSVAAARENSASDLADPDGDGLVTLLEAALGGDPLLDDSHRLPRPTWEEGEDEEFFAMSYDRPVENPLGLIYLHRYSEKLQTWMPADVVPGYPVDNGDGTETMKVRAPDAMSEKESQFFRLEIER